MSEPLDVARYIFMNEEGELRSGWRILAFFLFIILAASLLMALTKVFSTLFPSLNSLLAEPTASDSLGRSGLISLYVSNLRNLAAAAVASAVSARMLERRSFASIGFKLHRNWQRDFALGCAMGAAALAIAVGIAAALETITFSVQTRNLAVLSQGLAVTFVFFLIAGATEELIFRGFPFQALVHNLGGFAAVAITSVLFGLAHLANPSASAFSTINTILAGVWLGLAYLLTRSLWLATALHCSWNFAMVFVFGLPVSGFTTLDQLAWLRGSIGGPAWISGGSYGPEGGVAVTAALLLSTLAIWKSGLFTMSDEMLAAIQHGKREPAFISIVAGEPLPESTPSLRHQEPDNTSLDDETRRAAVNSKPDGSQNSHGDER
jgi:membrane protease YdiL (CAAX protease family)